MKRHIRNKMSISHEVTDKLLINVMLNIYNIKIKQQYLLKGKNKIEKEE